MRLLLILCTCVPALTMSAQELSQTVIGSAGTYFSDVNAGNLHFTVGELAVERNVNQIVLERGFHNGLYDLLSTSTWSAPEVRLQLKAYPNPTADQVTLTGDWDSGDRLQLTDLLGRRLSDTPLPPQRAELQLSTYPSGTYFLTVVRAGRPLHTLRVVRR